MGPLACVLHECQERTQPSPKVASRKAKASLPLSGIRILYITPLRAVSRDIEAALKVPVQDLCPGLLVESRTGDTKQSIRTKQRDRMPHVLVTTPESLSLLLSRENAQEVFSTLKAIIIDEWHELLSTKRGTQTELALARLRRFSPKVITWALSATLSNVHTAAQAVVGSRNNSPTIIQAAMKREVIIDSVIPKDLSRLPLAGHLGLNLLPDVIETLDPDISTLIFTNTRSQSERWFNAILAAKPEWGPHSALHHGSVDRGEREAVEAGLKNGALRLVVATSSLDLGVDFSPVERVIQIGSPKGIGRLMQRAGRASHRPMQPCRVTCVPTHGLELFEIDAARRAIETGEIEPRTPLSKPLDVLAQHLVTCGMGGGFDPEELYEEVQNAWSYRDLTRQEFEWSISLVRDGGGTLRAYPQYHRINLIDGRYQVVNKRIAQLHRLNIGTIVADSTIDIRYLTGKNLGRIEESFVGNLRAGDRFIFSGKVLTFVMMKDLTAYVKPAKGNTTITPIWGGIKLPITESLSANIRRAMEVASTDTGSTPELAAASGIVRIQKQLSSVPKADELLLETSTSKEGHHLFVFPFEGRMVHAGLAAILALRYSRLQPGTFSISVNDYGFELLSASPYPFEELFAPQLFVPDNLTADALASINMSELAKLQFREVARVAGLVTQNFPGTFKSSRQTQAGAGLIYEVLSEFDPENLLIHQARREVLDRHFEQSRLARCMSRLLASHIILKHTSRFTPLSFPLVIERQSALLSSQTILERIESVRSQWGI